MSGHSPDIIITGEEARALLRVYLAERGRGAQSTLAAKVGISGCLVSLMLSGDRPVNQLVAAELGLRAVRGFMRARSDG